MDPCKEQERQRTEEDFKIKQIIWQLMQDSRRASKLCGCSQRYQTDLLISREQVSKEEVPTLPKDTFGKIQQEKGT
jgi:hypothetical protein